MRRHEFEKIGLDYNTWYLDGSGGGIYAYRADTHDALDVVIAETVSDDGELENQSFFFDWEDPDSDTQGSDRKLTKGEFKNMCTLIQGFYINKLAKIKISYEQ
jgi:hypothetical protein